MPCVGTWGLVFKEWEVIKQTYPQSAQYLNKLTMTVDVDIYNGLSDKIKIDHMPKGSPIKVFFFVICNKIQYSSKVMIKRMKSKDTSGLLAMPMATRVLIKDRLKLIEVGPIIRTGPLHFMFRDGK